LNSLTEWLLALLDLLQLEGRVLRRNVLRLSCSLALLTIATLLLIAGVTLIGWGLYQLMEPRVGPEFAAIILGLTLLLLAGALARTTKSRIR
jgi:hypothetical protein